MSEKTSRSLFTGQKEEEAARYFQSVSTNSDNVCILRQTILIHKQLDMSYMLFQTDIQKAWNCFP